MGVLMSNYYRNWQYGITKEVVAIHEIVNPYDWELDVEMNEDFQLWKQEMSNKTNKENEYE
jgi:hypothetical protein